MFEKKNNKIGIPFNIYEAETVQDSGEEVEEEAELPDDIQDVSIFIM